MRHQHVFTRSIAFIFVLSLGFSTSEAEFLDIPNRPSTVYKQSGDIIIGGLFPLHQAGNGSDFCGGLRELGVLQRAEAMAFYINQINAKRLLPNVTLGFIILDDCYKETTALAQGLQFVQKLRSRPTEPSAANMSIVDDRNVIAVIGAESSTNSKQLAELLGLFEIPQVSYLSTSSSLSDRISFPYFTRIVPSDQHQIAAILEILKYFNWHYVSFVYTLNDYGLKAYLLLLTAFKSRGLNNTICIANDIGLPEMPSDPSLYSKVMEELSQADRGCKKSHVVILFMPQTEAKGILTAAQNHNCKMFSWIGSDAWGRNVQDFQGIEEVALGTILTRIYSEGDEQFDKHFSELNTSRAQNPFFPEFWNALKKGAESSPGRTIKDFPEYKPETTISLVKVAVYLIAEKLHELIRECSAKNWSTSDCVKNITGKVLQERLRQVKGCLNTTCIDIDKDGDGASNYTIMNFQKTGDEYILQKIGSYSKANSLVISKNAVFKSISSDSNGIPQSICSERCGKGHKQVRNVLYNSKCCWDCEKCSANEITKDTLVDGVLTVSCFECPVRERLGIRLFSSPVNESTHCETLVPVSLGLHDPYAVTIFSLNIFCFLGASTLLTIYVKSRRHRLIMATSLELSYVIWFGILFSHVSMIFFFQPLYAGCSSADECSQTIEPKTIWCYVQFVVFNLLSTIINAPILTRANRIHRIFSAAKCSAQKPRFIETKYQFVLIGLLICIQIAIIAICGTVSALSESSRGIHLSNSLDEHDVSHSYISCEVPSYILLPPVLYNLLLSLACAFHAFKTRKLPDNFNESKFIGMTVYTTIILWIAFVPSYITITSKMYKALPLTIALLVNAAITTGCLFLPRLYAVNWVDRRKMNVRSLSMSVGSSLSTDKKANRFSSPMYEDTSDANGVTSGTVTYELDDKINGHTGGESNAQCTSHVDDDKPSPSHDALIK